MRILHMSGAGNDFAVLDIRGEHLDLRTLAIRLCREYAVDGMLAVDESDMADIRLYFYNPDGLRGELCGNGARCVCKFAYDAGMVGQRMTVQTDAGIIRGWRVSDHQYRIELNAPSLMDLRRRKDAVYVELGDPGIPHSVTHIPGLTFGDREKLRPLALEIRHDPAFPKGVNVNFYDRLEGDRIRILTYERGVEDYTLACGTGSTSVALVLQALGQLPDGILTAENAGGDLRIDLNGGIFLEGPAETIQTIKL